VFYLFSAQFTVEVKHLSGLQSNHGSNVENFQKLLRHCNVLYSSTSFGQSISKAYFASSIHYVCNFCYTYFHRVLLYQHYRNILFQVLILEKFRRSSSSDGI